MNGRPFFELEQSESGPWKIAVCVDIAEGRAIITGLVMTPRDDYDGPVKDQQITASVLQRIPFKVLTQDAAAARAAREGRFVESMEPSLLRKDAEKTLEAVVRLYAEAGELGKNPRPYLSARLNYSIQHVDRLLRKARQKGLLESYYGKQGKHGKAHADGKVSDE